MLSKNEIKDIQSLRHKKFRSETGWFLAEGPKIVSEIIALLPQHIVEVYCLQSWSEQQQVVLKNIPFKIVTENELEKISQLQTPHQVVAVVRQLEYSLPNTQNNFSLYLDAIQDPGNFGTIIRIADWFGIRHVVCSEGCADLYNPKVIQSTMASIGRVNIYYDEQMDWLNQQSVPVYAAILNGHSLYGFSKVYEGILIIGNESKGIRTELLHLANQRITIPRRGAAESLNAAVATGIILSHLIG